MAKIVIVGGSGFVGSKLIPHLHGAELLNLDKVQSADFPTITRIVDVRRPESFSDLLRGADTVVLLAAEHRDDVTPTSLYYEVNVQGMQSVLAEMDRANVRRMVFTSTVAIYGLDESSAPSESNLPKPFNHYGKSKWEAEQKLLEWVRRGGGRAALILRPTVIFGEGNRGNVFNLLKQIHSGKFVMIGDGKNRKSMSYVENVVAFIGFMLNRGWSGIEIFNYADGPDYDMNALVEEVYRHKGQRPPKFRLPYAVGLCAAGLFDIAAKLTGRKFSISSVRVRKFCASTEIDVSKLHAAGFTRPFSLSTGIQRMLAAEFGCNGDRRSNATPRTDDGGK